MKNPEARVIAFCEGDGPPRVLVEVVQSLVDPRARLLDVVAGAEETVVPAQKQRGHPLGHRDHEPIRKVASHIDPFDPLVLDDSTLLS